jgi:hypothetical protein
MPHQEDIGAGCEHCYQECNFCKATHDAIDMPITPKLVRDYSDDQWKRGYVCFDCMTDKDLQDDFKDDVDMFELIAGIIKPVPNDHLHQMFKKIENRIRPDDMFGLN